MVILYWITRNKIIGTYTRISKKHSWIVLSEYFLSKFIVINCRMRTFASAISFIVILFSSLTFEVIRTCLSSFNGWEKLLERNERFDSEHVIIINQQMAQGLSRWNVSCCFREIRYFNDEWKMLEAFHYPSILIFNLMLHSTVESADQAYGKMD